MADCTVNVSAFAASFTTQPIAMIYLSPIAHRTTVNAVTFGSGAVDCTVNLSALGLTATPKATVPAVDIAPAAGAVVSTPNAVTVTAGTEVTLSALSHLTTMQGVTVSADCAVSIAAGALVSTMQAPAVTGDCNVSPPALSHLATMQAPTVEIPTVANVTGWAVWSQPLAVTITTTGDATVNVGALSLAAQLLAATVTAERNEYPVADDSSLRYSAILPTYRELVTERRVADSTVAAVDRVGKTRAVTTDSSAIRRNAAMAARALGSRVGTVSRTIRAQ